MKALAQTIIKETEELIEKIEKATEDSNEKSETITDLTAELEYLETNSFKLKAYQNNLRTTSCLEKLFDNFDRIPISELEELTEKYNEK